MIAKAKKIHRVVPFLVFIFSFFVLLGPPKLFGQHIIQICNDPCTNPTPTPTPIPTPTPTGSPSPTATPTPTPPPLAPGPRQSFLGTESYTYAVPLFSLPGRHGLDLNLALYYNSAFWTGPNSRGGVWPSNNWDLNPGFRLGFGTLEIGNSLFGGPVFIEGSGAVHPLKDISGNGTSFVSTDGQYIQVQAASVGNAVVTYKNGTQIFFSGSSPTKIQDTSGNFIIINGSSGSLSSVVDTTGRTLNFIYGTPQATGALACITDGTDCSTLGAHTYTFGWSTYTFNYNFVNYQPGGGVFQEGLKYLVVTSVTRPDGTSVKFNYGDWGIVTDIQEFSSNGTLRSETSYNFPLANAGPLSGPPVYTQKTVTTYDAAGNAQQARWNYQEATSSPSPGINIVTCFAVIDPSGTINMTSFSAAGNGFDGIPVQSVVATGSPAPCSTPPSTILRTVTTQWTSDQDSSSGAFTGINARPSSVTTVLEDGTTQSQVQFVTYDSHGNPTDIKQSDFGSNLPPLRETLVQYASNVGSIFNLPSDVQIKDSTTGATLSHQIFTYDGAAPSPVTPLPSYGFDSSAAPHGNLTGVTAYTDANAGSGPINTTITYDILGNQLSASTGSGTQVASTYSINTQYAYPDSISSGPANSQLKTQFSYDMSNGRVITVIDPNGQKTQTTYDIDARMANSISPENITTKRTYDDTSATPGITESSTANSLVTKTVLDFFGRPLTRQVLNGSTVVSTVSYVNDLLERPLKVSNPYGAGDTPLYTTFAYDGLGRQTSSIPPSLSGSTQNPYTTQYLPVSYTDFAGNTHFGTSVTTNDPAQHARMQYFDALGRLVRVDEPTGGSAATSGTGSTTVSGVEKSAQVQTSPATAGTGSVQLSGAVQWKTIATATTAGTTNITITGAEQLHPGGVTPGTGSVTIGGAEQSIAATAATGAVTFSGTLQSTQVQTQAATAGTGTVTIGGSEKSTTRTTCGPPIIQGQCTQRTIPVFDSGTVTITVNGHADSYGFGASDSSATIASTLATNINNDGAAFVSASVSGSTISLSARTTGAGTNYSLSTSVTQSLGSFSATPSGTALVNGQNAVNTTLYDSSSCTITANSHGDSSSWSGSGTTTAIIASALATAINADGAALVNATASGGTVNLIARSTGTASDYSLSASCGSDTAHFSTPSFTASTSGGALAGGKNAIPDAGTVSVTVNSHTNSVSFSSGSTAASIASALATNITNDAAASVNATASSGAVALTARALGSVSNYPLTAAVTFDPTDFAHSSFTATTSGTALTGGSPDNSAVDSGTMTVTINAKPYTVSWGQTSTPATIASALSSALAADLNVAPTLSGAAVLLDPKSAGTQYTFSTSNTYDTTDFTHSSFATTNSISDYGTTTLTANGHSDTVRWSGSSTPTSVATSLATQINGDSSAAANAAASGSLVSLTARTTGTASNYTLSSANAFDTAHFTASSFASSSSGASLAGGVNAVFSTVYDTGTVSVTVNGITYSVNYGQNDTIATINSALAAKINSGGVVNAAVSGGSLVLTSDANGAAANYTLATSSASSQSSLFSTPSFAESASGATLSGGADLVAGSLSSPLVTFYGYDAIGNLKQVNQGQQTRTYKYDGLRHLTSSCVPETGNLCTNFTYTDFGAVKTKLDPRNITTTFGFDVWDNVNDITYSDGITPETKFTFGAPGAANNGAGRLISSSYGTVSTTYQYDVMGRTSQIAQTQGANTYTTKNNYANGLLSSIVYPSGSASTSGTQVNYGYDPIGRLTAVALGATPVFSVNSYNAAGAMLTTSFGNGMSGAYGYNNQLQLSSIQYGSSTPLMNLTYNYGGAFDNGQIQEIIDNVVPSRSTGYAYDALSRLQQAQTLDQESAGTWNLKFTYDRYGNRLSETPSGGTASMPNSQLLVDPGTNHVTSSGFAYDLAGNMTSDGAFNYTFDAGNRITGVSALGTNTPFSNYGYDEAGERVNKNGNFYVYSGDQALAEYANGAAAASPSAEYIYAGGQRVATLANGALTYHYWDHLSNRANADANDNVVHTYGSFPFGETWYETGALNKWKFTTYENDSESGLNYANARFDSPAQGRFMSLDPLSGSPDSPQSLNRYTYVTNDPINQADPSGRAQLYVPGNPGGVTGGYDIFDALLNLFAGINYTLTGSSGGVGPGLGGSYVPGLTFNIDMFGNILWDYKPPDRFQYVPQNGQFVLTEVNPFGTVDYSLAKDVQALLVLMNSTGLTNFDTTLPPPLMPQPLLNFLAINASSMSLNSCGDIAASSLDNTTELIMHNVSVVTIPGSNGENTTKVINKGYSLVPSLNSKPMLGCLF